MMAGVYIEPSLMDGERVWVVKALDTNRVITSGKTVQEAVKRLEDIYDEDL